MVDLNLPFLPFLVVANGPLTSIRFSISCFFSPSSSLGFPETFLTINIKFVKKCTIKL